jgi:hypothetical protein
MYTPTPSCIQAHEYRRQERLAHAAQMRFIADARRSEEEAAAETTKPRPTFALSYARSLVASLASMTFALTTK